MTNVKTNTKTFTDNILSYKKFKVTILADTIIVTEINTLRREHESIELARSTFEQIIKFYERNGV